jgi:hypothetical protein
MVAARLGRDGYHHCMPDLRLLPFERDQLPLAEPWFQDADTNRWLAAPAGRS